MMHQAHIQQKISYKLISRETDLPYSTLMRWKYRFNHNEPIINTPGPKKDNRIDLTALVKQIQQLDHGPKRTAGTGPLYQNVNEHISRRDFNKIIKAQRTMILNNKEHIKWNAPGLIWSMDETKLIHNQLKCLQVQDLSSRYKLPLLMDQSITSDQIYDHLEQLFITFGAPLFLKRDNGSNLNEYRIQKLLEKYGVINLNSPIHYPPYNGGIERAQRELKTLIFNHQNSMINKNTVIQKAHLAVHTLNHKKRRILNGQTPCAVFNQINFKKAYNKRQRKEIIKEIIKRTESIITNKAHSKLLTQQSACRIAIRQWLVENKWITISKNQKVSPIFLPNLSHN